MRTLGGKRQAGMTLIELLVGMSIMAVLSTMIIMTWVSLSNSYSFTMKSARQRDDARAAISRMSREIRDAQAVQGSGKQPFVRTDPDEIRFYSTFNMAGAATPTTHPRLTRFIFVVTDAGTGAGAVYREFPGNDGLFDTADDESTVLVENVVNGREGQDIFKYAAYDTSGVMYLSDGYTTTVAPAAVRTVGITLLVDLNPGHSPQYMDVSTTVQPRNVRVF